MYFIHQLPLDQSATGTLREGTLIPGGTSMAHGQSPYLNGLPRIAPFKLTGGSF
jgi:hypothetical protein